MYKTRTVCRHCSTVVGDVNGSTSNMRTHIRPHHPDVPITGMKKKQTAAQLLIPGALKQPLDRVIQEKLHSQNLFSS